MTTTVPQNVVPLRPHRVAALESYVQRLARCRERLEDDLQDATQRIEWARHESRARGALSAAAVRLLVDAGVLADPAAYTDTRRLIESRRAQLNAIADVERITRDAIRQARPSTTPRREELRTE